MNVIEKIIAQKAGKDVVKVGDELTVDVDLVIAHDVTGPMAIQQFNKIGVDKVFDFNKVAFVVDHCMPAATVNSRIQHNQLKEFSKDKGTYLFNQSDGVIHQVIYEENLYKKGDLIVGADSHTCTAGAYGVVAIPVGATELSAVMALGKIDLEIPPTFYIKVDGKLNPGVYAKDVILHLVGRFGTNGFLDKAVIFGGETIKGLSDDEKMTISNMAIEMGAMIGYVEQEGDAVDEVEEVFPFKAEEIVPVAACPHSPGNVKPLSEIKDIVIDQVVIGSCTNGRYSDIKIAADVLKDKKVKKDVTVIITPASKNISEQMEKNGLYTIFRNAGAIVTNPGCGVCYGAHQGLLNENDVALSTTNRNFPGRMGHKDAQIYLVSPRTAAESAITGKITLPGTVKPL